MFTDKDLQQIQQKGLSPKDIEKQLENFRKGFPYVELIKPVSPSTGLKVFDKGYAQNFADYFSQNMIFNRIVKFVPASGAASRMFSHLFAWFEKNKNSSEQPIRLNENYDFNSAEYFLIHIRKLAFFEDLKKAMLAKGIDIENCLEKNDYLTIVDFLLNDKGLGYAHLPKALIKFHKYDDLNRTALDEHLDESADYCRNEKNEVYIHFTVSPEHIEKFEAHLKQVIPYFENKNKVKYIISHSIQKPSTDMIAVDEHNEPFRNEDGTLLFRPGGHGALIHNLNEITADIVFIKNIDNVTPEQLSNDTKYYKKVLGGYLLYLRFHVYEYLRALERENVSEDIIKKITDFVREEFSYDFDNSFNLLTHNEKIDFLRTLLNRPLRVCGMVKNLGEPGGGPFFVRDSRGKISQQIVESSQIDLNHPQQKEIFQQSTHFNPVDLACCFTDYNGKKFDLLEYVDPTTGFISNKSKDGRPLRAQELPGLWNGAMAYWNTVFVEVPITTFNPVKTVNDLLRKEHTL